MHGERIAAVDREQWHGLAEAVLRTESATGPTHPHVSLLADNRW